ncbi:cupin domain-containing protein [Thiomonas sp. FB-Cd]|uniref:cupin domain-containing protein n=1 Tax=Thiomonas sp. FB-Cd TaxID=1158292 RepID=UPI0004DFA5DE|nr:cupin domain-containing protein [Thiomonas sp. FB-Cd]
MRRSSEKAAWPLQGISHAHFLQRHWQRRPLLLRQAIPGFQPLLTRAELFALAGEDDAESRLVQRQAGRWMLRHGPFAQRSLPALRKCDWTLLLQGANLLHDGVAAFLERFRFLPDARLDDVMISWASDGGGVGPHVDAYDVFLVQAEGQRRWRIGPVKVPHFEPEQPLRILTNFEPDAEFVLDPGDVLYLPPGWGHDGVAVGACMTYSVGFRAPPQGELLQQLLWKLAEDLAPGERYSDRGRVDTAVAGHPAKLPQDLVHFLQAAFSRLNPASRDFEAALGELLTEPKQQVWFEAASRKRAQLLKACAAAGLRLDRRSRMLYTSRDVMINGERVAPGLARSRLLRRLADRHAIGADDWKAARPEEIQALLQWCVQGWAHPDREGDWS